MRIGEVLKAYRLRADMSTREMALQIGTSAPTLSRIERGYMCDAETLMRIFNYLTCPATGAQPKEKHE